MKRIRALILALSLLLSLAGCGSGDTQAPASEQEKPSVQPQQTTPAPSVQPSAPSQSKPKPELPELPDTIVEPIRLSSEQADTFDAFLAAQRPEYELFDLYDFEATLDNWGQMPSYTPAGSGIIQDGALNRDAFRKHVQQRNAEFLTAAKGTRYTALPDDEFNKVFDIVCTGIGTLLELGVDETLLDEKLGDLKILATSMSANGIMTHQDTILAINLKSVEAFQNSSGEADKFTGTVLHEVMHLGQISSDAERAARDIAVRVGPCFQWEDVVPHALFWEWYVEGSAEHLKMDIREETVPSVYEPFVRTLDAMSVALLPTHDPAGIYQQTLNADPEQFFALFGADTEEARIEILNMMCALDVALAQPDAFDAAYKDRYGKAVEDRLNYNERQIGAASLTLSKAFYRQLCDLAEQETSLAELFSLITAYETELARTVRYQNNGERNRPFIDGYNAIQTAFFEQLAACTGMTAEDIRGQYLAWYYGEEGTALYAPHLTAERQSWLQERIDRNAEQFTRQKAICEFEP